LILYINNIILIKLEKFVNNGKKWKKEDSI
jgi:hypothetical protein